MSKVYAALLLPVAFGLATKTLLQASGVSAGGAFGGCLVLMLCLSLLGDKVESWCFREIYDGRDRILRAVRFALLLAATYTVSFLLVTLSLGFSILSLPLSLFLAGGVLVAGFWYLGLDNHRRGGRLYRQSYAADLARKELQDGERSVTFGVTV
jgi:hypothetical protein